MNLDIDIRQEIIDHVSNNIIATLSFLFLLFGGFIFFIYYLYIQYLPDLNLIGSVTLLIFVSSTGLLLLLSTIFMFTMPGVFWHSSIKTFFNEIAALCDGKINKVTWFVVPIVFYVYVYTCKYVYRQ